MKRVKHFCDLKYFDFMYILTLSIDSKNWLISTYCQMSAKHAKPTMYVISSFLHSVLLFLH